MRIGSLVEDGRATHQRHQFRHRARGRFETCHELVPSLLRNTEGVSIRQDFLCPLGECLDRELRDVSTQGGSGKLDGLLLASRDPHGQTLVLRGDAHALTVRLIGVHDKACAILDNVTGKQMASAMPVLEAPVRSVPGRVHRPGRPALSSTNDLPHQ